MDNYIVRIYRRTEENPEEIARLVEDVEMQNTIPFRNTTELVGILTNPMPVIYGTTKDEKHQVVGFIFI